MQIKAKNFESKKNTRIGFANNCIFENLLAFDFEKEAIFDKGFTMTSRILG